MGPSRAYKPMKTYGPFQGLGAIEGLSALSWPIGPAYAYLKLFQGLGAFEVLWALSKPGGHVSPAGPAGRDILGPAGKPFQGLGAL